MANVSRAIRRAARALVRGVTLSATLPVPPAHVLAIPAGRILSPVAPTPVLLANAVSVGPRLEPDPWVIPVVMILVELGAALAIHESLEASEESERVKRFVQKAETAIRQYPVLSKYGTVTLMIPPATPIVGLSTSVPIGWLFRWKKTNCISPSRPAGSWSWSS